MRFFWFFVLLSVSAIVGDAQPLSSAPQLLIPAAGSTPGANGTFFHTDILLVNFANRTQIVRLQWLPEGISGTTATTLTLSSQAWLRDQDFVRDNLNQSGLGAIVVSGVTADGTVDPTAEIFATVRIWSRQPGTGGITSQSIPVVPLDAAITSGSAALFSIGDFTNNNRANIGIVNLDPVNTQTFSIMNPFGGGGPAPPPVISVSVLPMSMQQVAFGNGSLQYIVQNTTDAATRSNAWIAYGSAVNNITGDAWTELSVVGAPIFFNPVI